MNRFLTHWKKKAKGFLGKISKGNLSTSDDFLHQSHQSHQSKSVGFPACYFEIDPVYVLRIMQERGELYPWLTNLMQSLLKEMYDDLRDAPYVRRLVVRIYPFDGVAFTKSAGRPDNKEVHISSTYIDKIPDNRKILELEGVLCHEMVHAFQYDGNHTAPSGFIEGIADYFRLKLGLAPPHWNQRIPEGNSSQEKWDAGYEKTGFFFNFIERNVTPNAVKRMNLYLRDHRWSEEEVFSATCGDSAKRLYGVYRRGT